jgi:flagellar export protein FliJ
VKSFSFKLHALLRLKESKRDQALSQFAAATKQVHNLKQDLTQALQKRDSVLEILQNKQKGTFLSAQVEALQTSLLLEKENISSLEIKLNEAERILQSRRSIFLEKDSQFKAVLRLKEKQQSQHYLVETKKEETELEDVISSRFLFHRINHQY